MYIFKTVFLKSLRGAQQFLGVQDSENKDDKSVRKDDETKKSPDLDRT